MNKGKCTLSRSVRLALMLGLGMGMATPWAYAQTSQDTTTPSAGQSASDAEPSQLKGVVVTGSRIRQVDMETMQPILVMDRQEIEKTGMVTVGGILQHMTVGGNLTTNKQHVNGGGIYLGGAAANLRDLGAVRVLVLVNGKRWASNNDGVVDLSTIPSAVIQRIEVLKDGASAVYGSDAISGVINIITRKNYDGAEARVYYGQNELGDGVTEQYDFTFGTADENSGVMMNLSYTKQGAVWARSRYKTRFPRGPRHPQEGWDVVGPKGKFYLLKPNGDPGTVYALNQLGDDATNIANYHLYTGALSDKYNTVLSKMAKIPNEQKSLYAQGHYDFTDHLSFRATAMYTNRRARVRSSSIGLRSSSFSGDKGLISADSIYNPTNQDIGFYRRLVEAPSLRELTSRTRHLDATLKGWFMVG
ncbi:MAG TPA: TonB-dependent receptor plug domain-containing protein, partial [Oleiagrimonas sp.]|nr:TonB-dependent receptor plug domain-containing protein [Oleiagrimonas sp.]